MSSQFLKCSCTKVLPGVICIIQAFQIIGAQYFSSLPLRYGINEKFVQFWLKLSTKRNFVGHGFLSQWWGDNVHLLKTVSSLIFLSRLQSKWCNLKKLMTGFFRWNSLEDRFLKSLYLSLVVFQFYSKNY